MHVLLIENNNLSQTESLHAHLQKEGHRVSVVHTPETATQQTALMWPNLVVFNSAEGQLDMAGFQRAISQAQLDIPLILVSSQQHLNQTIDSDTIVVSANKPHQLSQSIQKAVARQKGRFLRFPTLTLDCLQYKVLRQGKIYTLTPKEFKLLHLLIENRNQVLSRKKIMQTVWETDYMGDTRTLDVHIRWLREKIEDNPSRPKHLITIRGVGYRFITDAEPE